MKALIAALAIVFATGTAFAEAPKKGTNAATKQAKKKPAAPPPATCKDDVGGCKKVKPNFNKKQNKAKVTPQKK